MHFVLCDNTLWKPWAGGRALQKAEGGGWGEGGLGAPVGDEAACAADPAWELVSLPNSREAFVPCLLSRGGGSVAGVSFITHPSPCHPLKCSLKPCSVQNTA